MHRGKEICNELKAVRRSIAEENGIDLEIPECPHKGPCPGTCPRCEAEVRYLENALASRIRMGKVATVAGITLGLSLCANAQSEVSVIEIGTPVGSAHQVVSNGVLKGTVIDLKTNEPLPFVKVALMQGDTLVLGGTTDFDGLYTLKPIPAGVYTLVVSSVGNQRVERQGIRVLPTGFTICDIALDPDTSGFSYGVTEIGTGDEAYEHIAIGEIQVKLPGTPASESGDPVQRRIEMLTPLPDPNPDPMVGAIPVPEPDSRSVQVQHVGPRLIVVEPEEPSL